MFLKYSILLMVLLNLISCSINVKAPPTRFLSPESVGKQKFKIEFGASETTEAIVPLTNNSTNNPLQYEEGFELNLATPSFGLTDQWDIFASLTLFGASVIGTKYQLIGDPFTKAKKGNFSLSIGADIGGMEEEADDDLFDISGNTQTQLDISVSEVFLLSGYRFSDKFNLYGSLMYSFYDFSGKVSSDKPALDGKTFKYEGVVVSATLGMELISHNSFFRLQSSRQKSRWDLSSNYYENVTSLSIGFFTK